MSDPVVGYGSVDRPFNEAFGRIIEVHWGGTVVIVEFPQDFAYIVSNDPASPDFPAIQGFYATDITIPKADYKDHWYLEPINDPDGRYYTSRSFLVAPAGYEGYGGLSVIMAGGGFPDPIGDGAYAPYSPSCPLAAEFFGTDAASDAEAYYDAIVPELQPLYTIVHREESGPDARVYNNGVWLRGITIPNALGSGSDPDSPADSANGVYQISVPDISTPSCALAYMKHATEVEVFQNTTNFQDGHSPAPTVKLRAYGDSSTPLPGGSPPIARQYFRVDAATKRLNKYTVTIDPDTGLSTETETTPKWTKTINLSAYPPARGGDTSLGKFNSKGFALPGDPLP